MTGKEGQPGFTKLLQSHVCGGQSAVCKAASPPSGQEGNEPSLVLPAGTNGTQGAALDTDQETL